MVILIIMCFDMKVNLETWNRVAIEYIEWPERKPIQTFRIGLAFHDEDLLLDVTRS
jgi:hypothetical protein